MGKKTTHGRYGPLKSEILSVRLTPAARELLKERAEREGVSISELIERWIRVPSRPQDLSPERLGE